MAVALAAWSFNHAPIGDIRRLEIRCKASLFPFLAGFVKTHSFGIFAWLQKMPCFFTPFFRTQDS
jgi:hypothetical protein